MREAGRRRRADKPSDQDVPTLSEEGGVRYLHFSSEWVQGAMRVSRPAQLVLEYTQQMMAWLLFLDPPAQSDIAMLGLGAGSLTRFCLAHTASRLRVVEWNPMVTAVCYNYFKLPDVPRLDIEHDDAGVWAVDPMNVGTCGVVMVDLYDAQAQGPVRDSLAFYAGCRSVLADAGIVTVNLFGKHESFGPNIAHLNEAFEGRVASLPSIDAGNQIVLAFSGPLIDIEASVLMARAEDVESRYGLPARRWARSLMGQARDGRFVI